MDQQTQKRIIILGIAVACVLLVPLVAMQFSDEVVWTFSDFVFAAVVLFGAGLTYILIANRTGNVAYRAAIGLAVATGLLVVWANGAVGLIGNEREPANLMYYGVLAVGFNGAIAARLRPRGMALASFATALATALVAAIALIAGMQHYAESSVAEILTVNGFFVELFIVTGLLFQIADRTAVREAV